MIFKTEVPKPKLLPEEDFLFEPDTQAHAMSRMRVGKFNGLLLKEVVEIDPRYILWMSSKFEIDVDDGLVILAAINLGKYKNTGKDTRAWENKRRDKLA